MRAMAIMPPGMFLSQPPITSTPSMLCPCTAVSIESAITSRETREYFMPSVPIEMPSETVMVPKVCGIAPAFFAAVSARTAENVQPEVARRDRAVAVGDADDRFLEIGVLETHRAQHRAIGRALHALGDDLAAFVD